MTGTSAPAPFGTACIGTLTSGPAPEATLWSITPKASRSANPKRSDPSGPATVHRSPSCTGGEAQAGGTEGDIEEAQMREWFRQRRRALTGQSLGTPAFKQEGGR